MSLKFYIQRRMFMYNFLYMNALRYTNLTKVLVTLSLVMFPICINAAPTATSPELDKQPEAKKSQDQELNKLKDLTVSPAPQAQEKTVKIEKENNYFYPYSTSMGPRLGVQFDSERVSKRQSPIYVLGFFYMLPSISSTHFEIGADLHSNSTGSANFYWRRFFFSTESFRPFIKGGGSLLIQPHKGLANFVDYKNYNARLGVGIEDLVKDPVSFRADLELTAGLSGYSVNFLLGYSWAW